jgi:prepilin-type N-terminal cleavage/methylation domain-containing protein
VRGAIVLAASSAVVGFCCAAGFADGSQSASPAPEGERQLFSMMNGERRAAGLAELSWNDALSSIARRHANAMAEAGSLFHTANLAEEVSSVLPRWNGAGENVAYASCVQATHQLLMDSPKHRENILGEFNVGGVGIWVDGDGTLWTTEVFAAQLPATPVPTPVAVPAASRQTRPSPTRRPSTVGLVAAAATPAPVVSEASPQPAEELQPDPNPAAEPVAAGLSFVARSASGSRAQAPVVAALLLGLVAVSLALLNAIQVGMTRVAKTWLRRRRPHALDEHGFTLVEMMVALLVITVTMMGLLYTLFGGMRALAAARERSAFLEVVNAEMESLRALPYDSVAVLSTDLDFAAAYPNGQYDGLDAVVVTPGSTSATPPPAVSTVTSTTMKGLILPYTVRRYVTWTDASGGSSHVFKRLTVAVSWTESTQAARSVKLLSVLYPGGLGPSGSSPNRKPVAGTVTYEPASQIVAGATTVSFLDSGASDPDMDPLTYSWNFGDGTTAVGAAQIGHIYESPGTFTAQVTVTDPSGAADSASADVAVAASTATEAPIAHFTLDQATGPAPLVTNLDASTSTDANGDPLTFSWHWGDGTPDGAGVNVQHKFAAVGSFTVTLTATDPGGLTGTASQVVTVSALTCDIVEGYFNNPSANQVSNDVRATNGVPNDTQFTFSATTNEGCGSIAGRLPYADGTWFTVSLSLVSDSGGVRVWRGTGWSSHGFSVGSSQTGQVYDTDTGMPFTFSFNVHA